MRTLVGSLIVVCIFAALATAQDPRPKLTLKPVGETIYDLSADAGLSPAADQSTGRGVVVAWCALTDESGSKDTNVEAQAKVTKMIATAMGELESVLLTAALAKTQGDKRANPEKPESSYEFTRLPSEIVEETAQANGSVVIVTSQKTESKFKNKDGNWETTKGEARMRFAVVKGADEKWRIGKVETGQPAKSSTPEAPVFEYGPYRDFLREVAYEYAEGKKLTKPELKTGTPEEGALSFANELRRFSDSVSVQTFIPVCKAISLLSEDWLTHGYKDAVRASVQERAKNKKPDEPPLAVEEVRDATDTSATVVLKFTDSKAKDKLVVKVVKEGGAWKVNEIGDLRSAGTEKEKYEPKADIYRRW